MKKLTMILLFVLLFACSKKQNPSEQYVIAVKGLILRSEPSQKSKSIALIPFKSKVTVFETSGVPLEIEGVSGFWCRVKWNAKEGWVFSGFIKPLVYHPTNIFLYNLLKIEENISPDVIEKKYSKTLDKPQNFELAHLIKVPDIIIDNELIVIDENGSYTDSINGLLIEFNEAFGWMISFNLKSTRKYLNPLFFRKSYYDTLSKTFPTLIKLKTIKNSDLENNFYKEFGKFIMSGFENLNIDGTKENSDQQEAIARSKFKLTMYDISGKSAKSYMAVLENKDYTNFTLISDGHIVAAYNGGLINSIMINNTIYLFFDYVSANSGDNAHILFTVKDGIIERIEYDGSYSI